MIETIKDKSTARNEYNFVPGFVMDIQRKVKLEVAKEIAKAKAEASREIAKIEAKAKEKNKQTIQKMLQKGYDIEEISELTGASIKEIETYKII